MNSIDLKQRTFSFALRIFIMTKSNKWNEMDKIILRQLVRSSSSIAANYRAALRSKSRADFLYKLKIVEEEADESYFWIEFLGKADIIKINKLEALLKEASELTAIFSKQCKTVKQTLPRK